MNHTAIFIPARMKATRLPNKPLADIGGKPMILHVMERAISANIGPVYVACADDEIALVVKNAGGTAILTDPNHPSGSDRIAEALSKIDPHRNIANIVNLQGDLPMFDPQILKLSVLLLENPSTDIGTFANIIENHDDIDNPNIVKVAMSEPNANNIGRALYFSRCAIPYQSTTYYHHVGIYIYRRNALEKFISLSPSYLEMSEKLEQLRALENNLTIDVAIINSTPPGVDTEQDLQFIRRMYNNI
jgi:3-deoxy-manno-octulosonate cytidylyltransferase (CMP-KDO synthetase)